MQVQPFALERYFARYEFSAKYMLSSSDIESLSLQAVLDLADTKTKALWDSLKLGYTESLGLPELREEIAQLYSNVSPQDVLVVVPEEGIFLALNAILEKGDHVIATFPGYQSLYELAKSTGCEVTKWEPNEEKGWQFDPEFLRASIQPNTKALVFNFPHNPTGALPTQEEWITIFSIAKENNLFVFSDEMYHLLEFDEANRLPSAASEYENAISLFGMSKTFGMPGVRIGWLITKNKEIFQKMATLKDYTTICSPAPSEVLSLIALRSKDAILKNHQTLLRTNKSALENFMQRNSELFSWTPPKAGSICFPRYLGEESTYDFCEKVVQDTGIMLLPSTVYDFGDRHVRIGFGRENFPLVLNLFEEYLHAKRS